MNRPMCIPICQVNSEQPIRLILAPMEGLVDPSMGGIDLRVAEFMRATNHLLSEKKMLRTVPVRTSWRTKGSE